MTTQLILPLIPRENTTPKPLEDLLSAIIGLLRAYGYSDQYTITQKEIYFSTKEDNDNG